MVDCIVISPSEFNIVDYNHTWINKSFLDNINQMLTSYICFKEDNAFQRDIQKHKKKEVKTHNYTEKTERDIQSFVNKINSSNINTFHAIFEKMINANNIHIVMHKLLQAIFTQNSQTYLTLYVDIIQKISRSYNISSYLNEYFSEPAFETYIAVFFKEIDALNIHDYHEFCIFNKKTSLFQMRYHFLIQCVNRKLVPKIDNIHECIATYIEKYSSEKISPHILKFIFLTFDPFPKSLFKQCFHFENMNKMGNNIRFLIEKILPIEEIRE